MCRFGYFHLCRKHKTKGKTEPSDKQEPGTRCSHLTKGVFLLPGQGPMCRVEAWLQNPFPVFAGARKAAPTSPHPWCQTLQARDELTREPSLLCFTSQRPGTPPSASLVRGAGVTDPPRWSEVDRPHTAPLARTNSFFFCLFSSWSLGARR